MAEGEPPSPESRINATGSGRPTLKDLYDHVVIKVADKWRDLGVQLLRSDQERSLNIIEVDHPRDAIGCCKYLFEKWVETNADATWNMLIIALRSPAVQLDYLASQLEKKLITESAVVTGSGFICEKMTNMQEIEIQFAKMTNRIKEALISNGVDVVSLIEQLCTISAVKTKKVPLFDEDMFEKVKSIDDFWKMLRGFLTIFDYDLLQCIVEISECTEARSIFKEFLSRIDPSAIQDVDLVLHCRVEDREGALKPVLRIKVNSKKCTAEIKNMVEKEVSKTYNLNTYALRFQGIKEGCIELHYCISKSLKLYLMHSKIYEDGLKKFLDHKIISLHVDEFELTKTSETTSKVVSAGSVHTEQFATIPEFLDFSSEHRGVAVIIGNSYTRTNVMKSHRRLKSLPNASIKNTQSMKEAFDYLKFLTIVKHNLTQSELLSLLFSLAKYPFPKSCQRFVLSFSGHGGDGFITLEDEKDIKLNNIFLFFTPPNCYNRLAVIPQLFFFDTYRGDLWDSGHAVHGGDKKWQSKIPSTGEILVAYATTKGYKAFEGIDGGFWSNILAKKLVSSNDSIYDVLTQVNGALIDKIKIMQGPSFQQPELLGRLNTTVRLLKESGQPPKVIPGLQGSQCVAQQPLDKGHCRKSPKSKLNEFCQSMKFPLPNYQSQTSNGFLTVTVSIRIEGQEVCYSYTSSYASEQVSSTKKNIKQCEEYAAEKAYKALTELYGADVMPLQRAQSYHESSDKPVLHSSESCSSQMPELQTPELHSSQMPERHSYPGENGSPGRKHKSQLNELLQKYGVTDKEYSSSDNVTGNVHNFRTTLTYTVQGRRYRYESRGVFGRKQDAEEDAAQQALCDLERQLKQPGGISYKQLLKERHCDERQLPAPEYTTQSSGGGFVSTVNVPQYKSVKGPEGNSKKEAEQLAAMEALRQLKLS